MEQNATNSMERLVPASVQALCEAPRTDHAEDVIAGRIRLRTPTVVHRATAPDTVPALATRQAGQMDHMDAGPPAATLPREPLLYVPSHPARDLEKDLAQAGIPKWAAGGKIDFHAARTAYVNFVMQSDASDKEKQTLVRHADLKVTMSRYAKAREKEMHAVADSIGEAVLGNQGCATSVQRLVAGAEGEVVTGCAESTTSREKWSGRPDLSCC